MSETNEPKFQTSDVLRMFPSFVWKAELEQDVHRSINLKIVEKLDDLRQSMPELAPGEAWQSDQALHRLPEFRELVQGVNAAVSEVLDFLKIGAEPFEITALWANMSAVGAAHRMHSHPNNFLSGVYYVQAQDGADTINFHDPRAQTGIIRPPVTELTAENTDQVVVSVECGTLLVFPAWLPHSVDANSSGKTRISLSFNIMFSRFSENMSQPLWQG